jgi:O-antigen/teichoic acid export membrane protein
LLLVLRVPPLIFAIGFLAVGVFGTAIIVRDSRSVIGACRTLRVSASAMRQGTRHLGGALYFWLMALAQALNINGIVLVIAAFASPVAVATYVTHRTIAGLVGYPAALLQAPLWPELTFLSAQRRSADLRQLALLVVTLVTGAAGLVAVCLWVLGPQIYVIWTQKALVLDVPLLVIFLIQTVLASAWATSGWALLAANRHRPMAIWSVVNGALTIGLAAVLLPAWGVRGAAAASLIADVVCGAGVVPIIAARLLEVSPVRLYVAAGKGLAVVAPLAVFAVLLSGTQSLVTTGGFLAAALLWSVVVVQYFLRAPENARFARVLTRKAQG